MTKRRLLLVLEKTFLAIGLGLGGWCAVQIVEARYFRNLPVPTPHIYVNTLPGELKTLTGEKTLPGDTTTGTAGATGRARVENGAWLAKLEAPSVNMTATILEGTDDRTLGRGAGHIEETPFPGEEGNFGIAGHRDTTFRPVRNLKIGDPLVVTTEDRVFHYRIAKTMIVEPRDVWVLDPADHPTLTLVTCYPFEYIGHAPHRFIISADLESEESR